MPVADDTHMSRNMTYPYDVGLLAQQQWFWQEQDRTGKPVLGDQKKFAPWRPDYSLTSQTCTGHPPRVRD